MPDPLTIGLGISAGASAFANLFGGKQKTTFEMSPEQKQFYQKLLGEYPLDVQQALLKQAFAPQFAARYRGLREQTAPLGSAQQVQAKLETDEDIQNALFQASLQGQQNVRGGILSLLGRGGTQQEQTGFGTQLSGSLQGITQLLAFFAGLKELKKK